MRVCRHSRHLIRMKDSDNSTQMIASTEQCPVHNQLFGKGNIKFNKTPYVYV